MIVISKNMIPDYQEINQDRTSLNDDLHKLISKGFIKKSGCYFLKSLSSIKTNVKEKDFIDRTGYECFINSIHVDDYIESDYLPQAYLFLKATFEQWHQFNHEFLLKGIITKTDFGANVKFHVVRPNEYWINEADIDNFEEGLIIMTSAE